MNNIEELDEKIFSIEADYKIYRRKPRENKMPDLIELVKLKEKRKNLV